MNSLPKLVMPGPPIGIIITQGAEVIQANGGLLNFMRHFTTTLDNGGYWLHKSRAAPKQDIAQVYLIVQNRLYGRCFYGGYHLAGDRTVTMRSGEVRPFPYPHMVLAGPIEHCPRKEKVWRGFQGFRYIYEPLW